ncbi:hypothetical protein OSTOST_14128, partial [Ostertagia ostertagi]
MPFVSSSLPPPSSQRQSSLPPVPEMNTPNENPMTQESTVSRVCQQAKDVISAHSAEPAVPLRQRQMSAPTYPIPYDPNAAVYANGQMPAGQYMPLILFATQGGMTLKLEPIIEQNTDFYRFAQHMPIAATIPDSDSVLYDSGQFGLSSTTFHRCWSYNDVSSFNARTIKAGVYATEWNFGNPRSSLCPCA